INKDLRVDGMNIVDEGGCSTGFVNLNMDAIGEVQVIANGYTAENGRNSGGLISVVTKSGTSTLKGSGWYNGRRDRFNANDYFHKSTNLPKPLYRVNISGYTVGGPVVIPGLLDSRGKGGSRKLYFFASQEYTDDARPTTTTRANLPTALERAGDFSQTRITNGTIQPIIDPRTGFVDNNVPGLVLSSSVTQVLKPTIVNEMTFGYGHNRYGFKAADDFDYRSLYASNLGINAPRIVPFGAHTDPPVLSSFGGSQVDQWPYAARFATSGGNRSNLAGYFTVNNNFPIPRLNISARASFSDDVTMTRGRHNVK